MSFEGRKLRISRIYEKKKLAKMRDKNEKLKLKPPNLIRGIEKCLNRKGEFKEKKVLERIPRTELSKYEEGRGGKVKSRTFKAGKVKEKNDIEILKATQRPIQELGVRNVKSKIVVPRNERSGRNSMRNEKWRECGLGDQTLRSRWNGKENRRERDLGDQTPRSRWHGNINRRGRGLGDRTPRRSVFERIRRYDRSRSRDCL